MKFRSISILVFLLLSSIFIACSDDDDEATIEKPTYDMSGYAKGADVSWLTEMEAAGYKFYDQQGKSMECMTLLRELGMNSIRLRVWVDPDNGWCNKNDLIVKAWRAHQLGMRLLIDFHYSDSWADPGKQNKPVAWSDYSFDELKEAVSNHTVDVLTGLKNLGISPEWVQVGNETGNGMLWNDGKASEHMDQYAALSNAGYDAVKSVFPDSKVIIHLQEGDKKELFNWLFSGLKENQGKWDVIGMSLYPTKENWKEKNDLCLENIEALINQYQTEVMICEVGMPWDEAETCKQFLEDLITRTKEVAQKKCLGVFYWEPQSYKSWNGYTLGAFDESGKPTVAFDAFN